ncbi:MAG TPA: hypothetical protein VGB24_24770 [Longimicrobium sp.]|jgi:hypothetical protein|uniref:hypothetical protein n=1 Tax=Longimicrobium sp. TaxID=2029185 RepID=UPI002ED923A1
MTSTAAQAQDEMMMGRQVSRFDLGVYAGGSLTSAWFDSRTVTLNATETPIENDDEESFAPGFGGAFGAIANFWITPRVGLRAHGAYLPMQPPRSDGAFEGVGESSNFIVNSYVYDLNLTLRPFVMSGSRLLSGMYAFVGGGGLTVDVTGTDRTACEPTEQALAACLPLRPKYASVGQGNGGIGFDLIPLGPVSLFTEAGVHVYDSPVHVGDDWVGPVTALTGQRVRIADDRTAVTGRLVLGLKAMFGNLLPPPPPVVMPPPPVMVEPAPVAPPPPMNPMRDVQVCVVENGMLRNVTVQYNTQTGDTTMNGQRFAPPMTGYAAGASWFINNEAVMVMGRRYVKYGLPRVLGVNEVTRVGEYQGVSVFAETGATGTPEVLYVPVRSGCEFQPYQTEIKAGAVRGD